MKDGFIIKDSRGGMGMERFITYEKKNAGYGLLRLNRSEKRNAISLGMANQLSDCIKNAALEEIKFLVITGSDDKMFSAGGDLNDLHGQLKTEDAIERLSPMMSVLNSIVHFPVPVIALLNGDALGGGCELATACDIRIAKSGTNFGFIQSKIGILPGWGGGAILYKKVHPSFALDWLTRGKSYQADELLAKGWLHQVIDNAAWQHMNLVLDDYIRKSVMQMRILKQQFKTSINANELTLEMYEELKNTATLWETAEHKRAVQKFFDRKV